MRKHTVAQIAAMVQGTPHGDGDREVGPDVVIDSRRVTPGALFIALSGEHVDGHDFITSAADCGAAAVIATRVVDPHIPTVVVDDTGQALTKLATALVNEADHLQVVGITGSSGKTSTKDLLAQLLARHQATVAPHGSFNNEIGVPLTACRIDGDSRYLVSEMGARGVGHVAHLCAITPPQVAVVLNVGHAHVGEFGSQQVIAQAKGELVEAARQWVVLNADDPLVAQMAERRSDGVRVAWFGLGDTPAGDLAVTAEDITTIADGGHRFLLTINGRSRPVTLHVAGRHQVANVLAAVAAALALGVPEDVAVAGVDAARPVSRWRMELSHRSDDVLIINDSYNANPDSMAAALDAAAEIAATRRQHWPDLQLWAVLGDMLELGDDAPADHARLGHQAHAAGVGHLIAIGEYASIVADAAREAGILDVHVATDRAAAAAAVAAHRGDIVLVKASRGLELDKVAETLLEEGNR